MTQFLDADVLVIGAPMYNFTIPSTLKAWVDRTTVSGTTFRYTASGPQGLAGGMRVIIASAHGGMHNGAPSDFQEPLLRFLFGFLGIDDVESVRAEGVAVSTEHRSKAIEMAIGSIVQPPRQAA